MQDFREELTERQTGLRGLATRLPGFKGYYEKELRREADKLLRTHLAERLQEQRNRLGEIQVALVKSKRMVAVGDIERAVAKLQRLIDRLKTASYGYAGWFDAVAVRNEDLDRLYQFDNDLMTGLDELAASVDSLAQMARGQQDLAEGSVALTEALQRLNDTLDRRAQVLYEE